MQKIKDVIKDVFFVGKLTKIPKKKLRILFSALVSNGIGILDIFIILSFSKILTNTEVFGNELIDKITDNPIFIPFFVIFRYFINFIGKYNIYSLTKDIELSLKTYILNEVYKKGNFSISDATYYIEQLSVHISYFFNAAANIITSLIQIFVFITFLSYDNFEVLLLFIALIILLYFPSKKLLSITRVEFEKSYKFAQFNLNNIQRMIENIYLVKILNTQEKEKIRFANNLNNYYKTEKRKFVLNDVNSTLPNFIALMSFSTLLIIPRFSFAITLEFIGVTLRLVQSLGNINSSLNMLLGSHVHLEKLIQIKENNQKSNFIFETNEKSRNAIYVENLKFKYINSATDFYSNLTLAFEKNKHHVITGDNGSGKSTLLGILTGALTPYDGFGEKSTNKMGYIGANPLILEDTLRENLTYASNKFIEDQELLKLINEFRVFNDNDINVLDRKINNKNLSSGQMQKISFIRAFVGKCEILFLDESTSNLDTETKKFITDILKRKKITIINSTHSPNDFDYDTHLNININPDGSRIVHKKL